MSRVAGWLTMGLMAMGSAAWAAEFEVLASFVRPGEQSVSPLVRLSDGSLYGTTAGGGAFGYGTVFKVTQSGEVTTLVSFRGGADGADPVAGLVEGGDGVLYGTTAGGGASGFGTGFRCTVAGEFASLVSFTGAAGPAKGSVPGGLVRLGDGFFYGVTESGGSTGHGTVFKMSETGVVTTLVEFTGTAGAALGEGPVGPLVAAGGVLFGVTRAGGASDLGTVFRMTPAGVWSLVAEFTGIAGARPGSQPSGGLRLHADGALYGTTEFGGAQDFGTCFRVTTASPTAFTLLRSFDDPSGAQPVGRLEMEASGSLYGVTAAGGASGLGTVFRVTTAGAHSVLAHLSGTSGNAPGASPRGGLTMGGDGAVYGTTTAGGPGHGGVVFRVTSAGGYSVVAPFSPALGWRPSGAPVVEASGSLLFPMAAGGSGGVGTLVRVVPGGLASVAATLNETTGGEPSGGLVAAEASWLGVTTAQGASGRGTSFRFSPAAGPSLFSAFTTTTGSLAEGPLLAGLSNDYFGVAREGGLSGHGTVYRLTSGGTRSRIVSFTGLAGAARGRRPRAPLALSGVNFYGLTEQGGTSNAGTLFRLSPAGVLTTLAEFSTTGPRLPRGGLVAGGDGFLYGTTRLGGAADAGALIRVAPTTGTWSVAASFSAALGEQPVGPLLVRDGSLFGVTAAGGASGSGTLFQYSPATGLSTLVSFTGQDGAAPGLPTADNGAGESAVVGLVAGLPGEIYGVAPGGGPGGGGIAFRLRLTTETPPFETWKSTELGTAGLPDSADPDADGLPILVEYALRLRPNQPDAPQMPAAALKSYTDGSRLHLILTRDPLRNDIALVVQAASELSGPWDTVATSQNGRPFSGPGYVSGDTDSPGLKTVEIRDTEPISSSQRRFMRLKINR